MSMQKPKNKQRNVTFKTKQKSGVRAHQIRLSFGQILSPKEKESIKKVENSAISVLICIDTGH